MAKETGTQAGDGATAATVDAKVVEAAKGATSVSELPESVFEVADPVGVDQSTPLDAAAVAEAATAAEVAEPAVAAPEAAAAAPEAPEATGDATEFDSAAFALDYGVKDADLVKDCADEGAALKVLARRAAYWSERYGKQTDDVGASRRRIAELEAALAARPDEQTATEAVADTGRVAAAPAAMTPEETEEYLQLQDTDPVAARRMMDERLAAGAPVTHAGLTAEDVEELLRQRDAMLDAGREATALDAAHPGWAAERKELMDELAREIGWYPPLAETYDLAGLRHQDPAACAAMVAKMQAGASYADARILVVEYPANRGSAGTAGDVAATGPSAQAEAERRARAAQAAGPGKNSSATAQPSSETAATSLDELPRKVAGGMF